MGELLAFLKSKPLKTNQKEEVFAGSGLDSAVVAFKKQLLRFEEKGHDPLVLAAFYSGIQSVVASLEVDLECLEQGTIAGPSLSLALENVDTQGRKLEVFLRTAQDDGLGVSPAFGRLVERAQDVLKGEC